MASNIDPTKPVSVTPTTESVRTNFDHAKNEIEALQTGKEPVIAAGTAAQYLRGDKTMVDFFTDVRAATLTGLSTATNAVISATDTVLSAFGKLQKQISDHFAATASVHGSTSSNTASTIVQRDASGRAGLDVLGVQYDSGFRRISNPGGGYARVGSVTGALRITLPVGMLNNFLSVKITVFNYASGASFDVRVMAYSYPTGNTWQYNPTAFIVADDESLVGHSVRLGYTAGGKAVIYIGELATAWAEVAVWINDVGVGFSDSSASYLSGWVIGYEASAFENVTATVTDTQVGWGTAANTAKALVRRDSNGDISASKIVSNADTLRLTTLRTITNSTDSGTTGDECQDANYRYKCIATNTWVRSAYSTW